MVMDENTYFAFAEADYPFFLKMCEAGDAMPGMAAVGQSICERYLKHVIDVYSQPKTKAEEDRKAGVMRTHSLTRLTGYIRRDMEIDIPYDIEDEILKADGFYFSTRYPGDNSHIATDRDIKKAYDSVMATREFTCRIIQERENEVKKALETARPTARQKERLFGPGGRVERARAKADELNKPACEQKYTDRSDPSL